MSKTSQLPKSLTTVTTFSKVLAVLIIFAFILSGAYVGMVYQRMIDMTIFSSLLATSAKSSTNEKIITLQDNNKTIPVHVGDIVNFSLGSVSQRWNLSFSSNILKRVPSGPSEKSGQEGKYMVIKNGTVVISGIGISNCPAGEMCPMYAVHFSVTIVASR